VGSREVPATGLETPGPNRLRFGPAHWMMARASGPTRELQHLLRSREGALVVLSVLNHAANSIAFDTARSWGQ
jgi:hypothetical protein